MEILLTVELKDSHAVPIQINIVYRDDGEIASVDWRHALPDIMECLADDELEEYDSDDDEEWLPPHKISFEEDEPLEYDSSYDDSDDSDTY